MNTQQIVKELSIFLKQHKNLEDAPIMKGYMPNKFEFFGLKKACSSSLMQKFLGKTFPSFD